MLREGRVLVEVAREVREKVVFTLHGFYDAPVKGPPFLTSSVGKKRFLRLQSSLQQVYVDRLAIRLSSWSLGPDPARRVAVEVSLIPCKSGGQTRPVSGATRTSHVTV